MTFRILSPQQVNKRYRPSILRGFDLLYYDDAIIYINKLDYFIIIYHNDYCQECRYLRE